MLPHITVVTPSFNQGNFLEATLRSVIEQGYANLEYIVIDGGSTDASIEVLDRHRASLAYVQSQPDRGQTDALIQGLSRATGDILGWLNSDDLYEPGALAEVGAYFKSNPSSRFVFGDSSWIDEGGRLLRRKREMPFNRFIWLRTYDYIPQPSAFWRRDLYEQVGGLDPAFDVAMDADLFARFADVTRLHHVSHLWSRMRSHSGQKNVRLREESDREEEIIRRRYGVPTGARGAVERALARASRVAVRAGRGAYWR